MQSVLQSLSFVTMTNNFGWGIIQIPETIESIGQNKTDTIKVKSKLTKFIVSLIFADFRFRYDVDSR